jgi:hypothetical protein
MSATILDWLVLHRHSTAKPSTASLTGMTWRTTWAVYSHERLALASHRKTSICQQLVSNDPTPSLASHRGALFSNPCEQE